jgi:hypothetical protein
MNMIAPMMGIIILVNSCVPKLAWGVLPEMDDLVAFLETSDLSSRMVTISNP